MAGLGRNDFSQGDPLFVSPDNLMIDHDLNSCFRDSRQQQQPDDQYSTSTQQSRSVCMTIPPSTRPHLPLIPKSAFAEQQRPNLSLPVNNISEWTFRPNPPPTPVSPFRPLTEDQRLAFPCLSGPENCWNPSLCPKHRAYPDTPSSSSRDSESSSQTGGSGSRRRSCPSGDGDDSTDRIKPKRHSTAPERPTSTLHHRNSTSSGGRVPHNLIERRYRDNLNHQIENLRLVLPNFAETSPLSASSPSSSSYTDFSPRAPSKAQIISTATKYIRDMEIERKRLISANEALQDQVEKLQKLVRGENIQDLGVVGYLNAMSRIHSHSHSHSLGTTP